MSEIHDAGIPVCPSCGQTDRVQGVPAVYRAGIDTVTVRVAANGDEPAHDERRTVTTALAKALAPAPASGRGCGSAGLGAVLFVAGVAAYASAAAAGHWRQTSYVGSDCEIGGLLQTCGVVHQNGPSWIPHGQYGWLGWLAVVVFLTGLVLAVLGVLTGRALNRRLAAGKGPAEALWSRGWYCGRCGTAHFRATAEEPARPLALGEFRQLVWSAGGYGDLIARYPVT